MTSATYQVGDPDPTPHDDGTSCRARLHRGVATYHCTWEAGHTGQHVAGTGTTIVAVWDD